MSGPWTEYVGDNPPDRGSTPPVMASNVNGPLETLPSDFYHPYDPSSPLSEHGLAESSAQLNGGPPNSAAIRSMSKSPVQTQMRSVSGPPLSGARSHPVLAPRQPGVVMDIATRFDQGATTEVAPPVPGLGTQDGQRQTQRSRSAHPRSPVKSEGRNGKLQKRRPVPHRSSPRSSPKPSRNTSFDTTTNGTNGSVLGSRIPQQPQYSPKKPRAAVSQANMGNTRPLFGEITSDGSFHGNFSLQGYEGTVFDTGYGSVRGSHSAARRQSESNVFVNHDGQLSHYTTSQPTWQRTQPLGHKRSRSDMDGVMRQAPLMLPLLNTQNLAPHKPSRSNQGSPFSSPTSRIPVSSRYKSDDDLHVRSSSSLSNPPGRSRLPKSPTKRRPGKENAVPSTPNRYHSSGIPPPSSNQTLSAKIVAPPAMASPPLRSSRPRQPVSSATTSASRARAADRFQGPNAKDVRRPSEQWLGKPYEPQKERTRRKIPELGKVDFAERRARIQQAINQNLDRSRSQESRKASRQASFERIPSQTSSEGAMNSTTTNGDRNETEQQAHDIPLSIPEHAPLNASFGDDESPVLGRHADNNSSSHQDSLPLLTSATYSSQSGYSNPPAVRLEPAEDLPPQDAPNASLLDHVMRLRNQSPSTASRSGTEFADSPTMSAEDSPSDMEGRWGLAHSPGGDQGSIRIMLDDPSSFSQRSDPRPNGDDHDFGSSESVQTHTTSPDDQASRGNGHDIFRDQVPHDTPRSQHSEDDTLKASAFQPSVGFMATSDSVARDDEISRMLDQYQTTGAIAPEMHQHLKHYMVDLNRISARGGSDAVAARSLLNSVNDRDDAGYKPQTPGETLPDTRYHAPLVTPDTPPDAARGSGTALVFSNPGSTEDLTKLAQSDEDFEARIRKADEDWERRHNGEDAVIGASNSHGPTPPPKDFGYTPRSSVGPGSDNFGPGANDGLRISTSGDLDIAEIHAAGDSVNATPIDETPPAMNVAPPFPNHAPPVPPQVASAFNRQTYDAVDRSQVQPSPSERESNEFSPRNRRSLFASPESSRPSMDSQRNPGIPPIPGSYSMSSLMGVSTRTSSVDTGADSATKLVKTQSPGPEQKRLMKRRHIIRELLDTENTYHQDLKIIEDIYKATVADLVPADDKKTLFGNCDEIERFSLHFYDDLRKAVSSVYVPAKQMRWLNKRGSYSTTHSDQTGQTSVLSSSVGSGSADGVSDEKDRTTSVGQTFLNNLQQMDQVYGVYLKNHDAANQRLAALKGTPAVKCWLDECHNNASDITSAWDLDSLLVKPTQRVSKYPMLLQQLLESTPPDHPDHEALKVATADSVAMLTRINDAKKRADIVDQIINRKGRDSDVRSGIAKAFGRTNKLKDLVNIAENHQDKTFDDLAHKFGGHFIRLQICMRDVQDYLHRIDTSMEQITNCAGALELFTDVNPSSLPEIESKWRRYGQAIREIVAVAFTEHKASVQRRVVDPMVKCIKLHEGPQSGIALRKKLILEYAKAEKMKSNGEKLEKKHLDASSNYLTLNEQLKSELPKLYSLTATLVQSCLRCFLDIQLNWYNVWERKLRPTIDAIDIPASIHHIEPAFRPDYDLIKNRLLELGICNGSLLADSANFLSPTSTLVGDSEKSSMRTPSSIEYSKRTRSVGSESSPNLSVLNKRYSSGFGPPAVELPNFLGDGRMRSNSSYSNRGTPGSTFSPYQPWSPSSTPGSTFSPSRPDTANQSTGHQSAYYPRTSNDHNSRPQRPSSSTPYVTALPERPAPGDNQRFSGMFNSALPPSTSTPSSTRPSSPKVAADDTPVMFVCASLFEFSIDKTRREGGYPYLTYVQGEVFDVIAQKGELWLAKNQDDSSNSLGWIWEQHFVILSGE